MTVYHKRLRKELEETKLRELDLAEENDALYECLHLTGAKRGEAEDALALALARIADLEAQVKG